MIVTENLKLKERDFVRTYSFEGFYIERDGVMYAEAIDPAELHREYTETDIKIEVPEIELSTETEEEEI